MASSATRTCECCLDNEANPDTYRYLDREGNRVHLCQRCATTVHVRCATHNQHERCDGTLANGKDRPCPCHCHRASEDEIAKAVVGLQALAKELSHGG